MRLFQDRDQAQGFLVAGAGWLDVTGQGLFHGSQVGQREFGVDDLDVRQRVHLAGHVDHVVVFETAHHVGDGVGFADIGQELVAQAFALGRARDQAGDVDELDRGRQDALRLDDFGQAAEPRIRHFDHAHVGLDRAERIVFGGDAGLGQGIEQRGLADVGQADDAAFEAHGLVLEIKGCGMRSGAGRAGGGHEARWSRDCIGRDKHVTSSAGSTAIRGLPRKTAIVTLSGLAVAGRSPFTRI
ncbi:hypothetical protein D9M70_462140 [compost metagenome]